MTDSAPSSAVAKKAVVLLSGGLDSATVLAMAHAAGYAVHALTVDYGQRHRAELTCARQLAQSLGVQEHKIVQIDLRALGGSALTAEVDVPFHRDDVQTEPRSTIPVTYVPARNTILLAIALGYAEVIAAFDLYIGVNAVDYSGYPDCRPEFVKQFAILANVATKAGVEGAGLFRIHAPLISWSKTRIIQEGMKLGVDYRWTLSCYQPDAQGRACGKCDSCHFRRKGFEEAGLPDPTHYQS